MMQRIDSPDQCPFAFRPAPSIGAAENGGADLLGREMRGIRERRNMHAPFVLAASQRAGPVDDNLALAQRERTPIEQTASAEFLPGTGVAGHDTEQRQRWRAAHDPVELILN